MSFYDDKAIFCSLPKTLFVVDKYFSKNMDKTMNFNRIKSVVGEKTLLSFLVGASGGVIVNYR